MNLYLKNIGLIKETNIQLDGLTVITGKNSSGKTTVGKVLYSLIDSTIDIEKKAENDKKYYISKVIDEVRRTLDIFRFMYRTPLKHGILVNNDEDSAIATLFSAGINSENIDAERFIHLLYDELKNFDAEKLVETGKINKGYSQIVSRSGQTLDVVEMINFRIEEACMAIESLFSRLKSDTELINFTRENINQTLDVEFSGQIQPILKPDVETKIELYDETSLYYNIDMAKNKIIDKSKPAFISSPFNKVFLVDDPYVLDRNKAGIINMKNIENRDTFLNIRRIVTHDMSLARVLRNEKNSTVLEDSILKNELDEIKKQIDETVPGTFEFSNDGQFYVQNNKKLQFSNLATGSKMISIIKILFEKGLIDKNTLLILDEPEAHLHPKWQNVFAEIVVMLVEKLNVNIVLTTHSSNFMLALDAYMRKYKINSKCNFYQTEELSDGFVDYKCVNEDMGQIYADFMESMSQVKILRSRYLEE